MLALEASNAAGEVLLNIAGPGSTGDLNRAFSVSISTEISLEWFNDL
jgi:hypothetical protein